MVEHAPRWQVAPTLPRSAQDENTERAITILSGTMHCNDVWTDWRTTGYGAADKEEETLDLATGEDITSISGRSDDYDGSTYSLQAETSSGRQWGPYGNHSGSLRLSPPTSSGLKLHHLSGDQSRGSWIIRWLQLKNH